MQALCDGGIHGIIAYCEYILIDRALFVVDYLLTFALLLLAAIRGGNGHDDWQSTDGDLEAGDRVFGN